jgi:PAS domain S-box-containing protein
MPKMNGIEFIDEVPWGTHLCQFYQSKEDLIEILVPYFKQGLENNEFCMWVTSEPLGVEDAKTALKEKVKNLDDYIRKGQIEILDYKQWYTATGRFEADKVLEGWVEKEKQAIEKGFDGLRLTGNTFWLKKKDWQSFADYEAVVNSVIRKHRMLAICSYSLDRCQAEEVIDVVNNHQFALIRKEGKWTTLESTERRHAQVKLQQHIKHLNCLYGLSRLAVQPQISLDQIFQETTGLIRSTYRYPDITCVRITFNGIQYKTDNFRKTEISQWGDILVRGEKAGSIEVYCLEKRQENGEGSFLKEEGALLDAVCEKLGRIAGLKQATDKLRLFRTLIDKSNDCIFILEPKWGRFLDVNDRACESLRYSRKELLEMSIKDIEEFPEGLSWQKQVDELKLKGDIIIQGRHKRKDGTRFFAETSLKFVKEEKEDYIIAIARDITERKQAEEALRESEERYRIQFEQTIDALFLADTQTGIILECNRAAIELIGREKSEMVGQHQRILHPSEEWDGKFSKSFKQHITGETFVETKIIKKSGEIRNVAIRASTFDLKGQKVILAIFRDITERKQAEEALRESEARYKTLFAGAPDGMLVADLQTKQFRYANPSICKMFGYTEEEFLQIGVADIHPKESLNHVLAEFETQARGEKVLSPDLPCLRKDGTLFYANISGIAMVLDGRKCNVGFFTDVTERKQVEEKLRASENKYKTLLVNLPQRIFYKDKNSVYVSCNENYARDLKIKLEEIAGKTDYDFHPKDLAEKYRADDRKIMESGKSEDIEEKYIKDGQETVVYTVKTPVKDEQGNVIGILGIFWDILERKRAEQRQAELLKEVESVNRELKDFAYVVSHDLKAPLRGIKTLASWLSADYADKLDEQGKEQIRLLSGRVDRMNNLINGVLEYSRVGRIQEKQSLVDLNKLVPEIIDMIAPPENINITVENELPKIECEPTRITQVFQNLLSNAVKYMDKPQGLIKVGCIEENGFWKFGVSDNGPGIEEKFFEKIFQIFQTLAPRDSVESTGIGLTVAKKIVELYGGRIWVESKVGEGSTFFFTLPKQKAGVTNANVEANITC